MKKKISGSVVLAAMFVLLQMSPRAQETAAAAGRSVTSDKPAVQSLTGGDDLSLFRLVRQLTRFRKAGDAESAARIFAEIFPSEETGDPIYALKTGVTPPADGLVGAPGGGKLVVAAEGAHPVFATPEHELNPSADFQISPAGVGTYYSAAEQWMGDRPGYIRVRKSTDSGSTWSQSLVLGNGRAATDPSLRLVTDDAIGVAYVREWDASDGDIYFARLDAAMTSAAEIPVALSLSGQSAPSIATDREAYASPYVYLAYAERQGTAGSVKFRVSPDLGTTWSRATTVAAFPWPAGGDVETALAFDPDESALHLAYVYSEGTSTGVAVATSRDYGASWSTFVHLTTAGDGPARHPAIAARAGAVVVAYEHEVLGKGSDVGMAYSSDSGRNWTRGAALAASALAERSPDVRSLAGEITPSFFASFVEANERIVVLRAAGSAPGSWTTEFTYPEGGTPTALGSAIVLPMPSGAGEGSAGVLWTDASVDDDIFFSASAHILAPGPITVTPPDALVSSGLTGGPFTPSSQTYTVTNTGDEDITYHFTKTQAWTTVDPAAVGTLAFGASITVTVSINEAANSALPGNYNDTVTFANLTNGTGNTTRQVTLNISPKPGDLAVTPAVDWASTGVVGGPFTPPNQTYLLQNTGESSLNWTCAKVEAWTTLSATSGTLAAGASTSVTVSINTTANGLAAGIYTDVATFTNTTNGQGNTTRSVTLTVTNPGVLAVTPATGLTSTGPVGGPFTPSSQAYTLENTGGTAINWTATNVQTWTSLSAASGTLTAGATTTVTVSINAGANALVAGGYADVVTFTNTTNGTGSTNRAVTLTVTAVGALAVTPAGDLTSTGPVGGPFTPSSQAYTLQNTGGTSIDWTCTKIEAWTTLSAASGTLAAGATATVTVSINTAANALAAGTYNDTVTFTNTTNGNGNATRAVALTVTTPGDLSVSPAAGLASSGPVGGPFDPTSRSYTLRNTGGTSLNWTAAKTQNWTSLYVVSGTLAPDATVTVDILINNQANGLAAGTYNDTLTFTNTTNGNGNTTRGVTLTVTAPGAMAVTPATGLTSSGTVGGPFTPSSQAYTLENTGGTAINWTAANGQAWTTLSATSGSLAAGATATVSVSINTAANALAAGTYADTVTFTNTTNASGNTTRAVTLTIGTPGALTVTPAGGLTSSGTVGGPFAPSNQAYTLQNTGGQSIDWTAAKTQAWTTLSAASGTLAAGATTTVTVSINTAANSLAAGTYADTVTITNTTNGTGNATRAVALTVTAPGVLTVTPVAGLTSAGPVGGPFTPSSQSYTLENTGGTAINWTAAKTQTWTSLYVVSGTLAPGASITLDILINNLANGLAAGTYNDTLTITNTTNGTGNTTRGVTLAVSAPGVLAVTPATGLTSSGTVGGPFTPSSQAYTLQNTGGTAINWTATNGQTWTTLSAASGTLAAGATATVTVSINSGANALGAGTYTDTIIISNTTNGSGSTTRPVTLTVGTPGALTVTPATGLTSSGTVGGPFAPSNQAYTLQNTGGQSINWTAAKTQAWTTLSAASGTLAAGATTTVTISINTAAEALAAGTYNDTLTITNTTNGTGNTTRAVALTVTAPGVLTVTPAAGLTSTGPVGGPFAPSSQTYTLENTGGTTINWTAAKTQTWTSLYVVSGTLAPGASITLDILINNLANGLAAGTYNDTLTITNTTNGSGNTTRGVTLTVTSPGVLAVTPATALTSSGTVGGPFTPSSQAYMLQNTGGTAINWTCTNGQAWTTLSATSGSLAAGATATVTVSINTAANGLAAGTFTDTIIISNTTNGTGNTTRGVTLTVSTAGALAVTPGTGLTSSGTVGGPFTPSSQAYTLENTGDQSLNWTAAKTQAWTTLSATSGTLAAGATATVTVSINAAANSLGAGSYTDTVTFTNTTNGSGNTTRPVALTVAAPGALSVSPSSGLTSAGPVGGPFSPTSRSYTLRNTGGSNIDWTAAKTQNWTSLYVVSGTLAPDATVTVDILINNLANNLAAGTYNDTLTFTNTTNGTGNTTRGITLTVSTAGVLAVTPTSGLTSSGLVGGPFTPSSQAYTLQNTGGTAINWTCTNGQAWTTLSAASGSLAAGATATVTVSVNSAANALAAGTYADTVTFTNTTNAAGNTTRAVTLTVGTPGVLAVTPGGDLISSGLVGGPFAPSNQVYTLQNTGGQDINWTCTKLRAWTTLSAASGTLAAGATATVTVSINSAANSLAAGTYTDTVTFTNTTNGTGNATRGVTLSVSTPGALSVTPAGGLTSTGTVGGPFTPSSQSYTLQNTGGSNIDWTASKTQTWTSLFVTSGTLAPGGSVTLDILINNVANSLTPGTYHDTLTITNTTNGTGNTTRSVTLTVASAGVLSVTPAAGLTSSGLLGGPFTPSSQAYTLQNTGGTSINWASANGQAWTTLSAASGTLAAGASTTVTVSINSAANGLAAGTYNDTIIFSNITNGSGNTTRPVALTVSAPGVLSITPTTGLTSSGLAGGPFTPSSQAYTLQNTGGTSINWTSSKTRSWTTLSATSGTLAAGATATVTVTINSAANSLAAGTYNDTVTFTNTTNGTGNTTRAVALTVYAPGDLAVTPTGGLTSTGPVGGPFTPLTQTYTLRNTGGSNIDWTAAKTQNWTSLYVVSGTLAPGASVTVDILINNFANSLAAGTYNDTLTITNTTNGSGNTTRPVVLTVTEPGVLAVNPAGGLTSAGLRGGPFSPSSQVYTLQNTGGTTLNWTSTKSQAWTTLSAASGTLAPGGTATVTVTINSAADSLAAGVYNDSVTFTNATNALGNTARAVTLTVNPGPDLAVDPGNRDVPFVAGTTTFDVSNAGGGTLNWTATVIAGGDWLSIVSGSSGTGAGTITAAYAESGVTSTRVGTIRISAPGSLNSPRDVTVTQTTSALLLSLTAQRLVERAWLIQREYGRLTVTVSNPGSVAISSYVISRSVDGGDPVTVGTVAATTVTSPWVYNDTFLEQGKTYTYRVLALDGQGNVIGATNAITI